MPTTGEAIRLHELRPCPGAWARLAGGYSGRRGANPRMPWIQTGTGNEGMNFVVAMRRGDLTPSSRADTVSGATRLRSRSTPS